jgi:hypothetical protein
VSPSHTERLEIIIGIIKRSRRALQLSMLRDDALVETAQATNDLIGHIPTLRLIDAYREAMRIRDTKGALQPQELIDAWYRLKSQERATAAPFQRLPGIFAPDPECRYCNDTGWQAVDQPERGIYRHSVRPCICDVLPNSQRSNEPLGEPYWEKSAAGTWVRI